MAEFKLAQRTSIDVVREGRFRYVVVERMSNGLDMSWEPGHWFRWRACRAARRYAAEVESRAKPVVVLSIPTPPRD